MVEFRDPAIERKSSLVNKALVCSKDGVPLPSVVEVSESGTCNRDCSFCPRSDSNYPDDKTFIDPALIDSISCQLADVGFKGMFLFSGFCEPLLDNNIYDLVAIVHGNLPAARVEMVTNGDVLDASRLKRLFDKGLDTLLISVYDGKEEADAFEALCRSVGLRDDQFIIRKRYLPREQNFGITLSNRAGLMGGAEFAIPALAEPLQMPCSYPHYTFFFDYTGDVLLCPHDWGKKQVVGNLSKQDFMDIWISPKMSVARRRLASKDRAFSPCNVCDVKGMLIGGDHVRAWRAHDEKKL